MSDPYGYSDPNDPRRRDVDPYAPALQRPQFSSGGLTQGGDQGVGQAAASGGQTQAASTNLAGLLSAASALRASPQAPAQQGQSGGILGGLLNALKSLGLGGTTGGGLGGGYRATPYGDQYFGEYGYTANGDPLYWGGHDPAYGYTGYETYGYD